MKILGLPGRDQATVPWLRQLLAAIGGGDHDVIIPGYRHWGSDQPPDPAYEAGRLNLADTELVVAKSMGTMVLLELLERDFQPRAAVLIGVPLQGYNAEQTLSLKALPSRLPCLCIQQTDDFTGSYQRLAQLLNGSDATLKEVSGADHVYRDTEELAAAINAWSG